MLAAESFLFLATVAAKPSPEKLLLPLLPNSPPCKRHTCGIQKPGLQGRRQGARPGSAHRAIVQSHRPQVGLGPCALLTQLSLPEAGPVSALFVERLHYSL